MCKKLYIFTTASHTLSKMPELLLFGVIVCEIFFIQSWIPLAKNQRLSVLKRQKVVVQPQIRHPGATVLTVQNQILRRKTVKFPNFTFMNICSNLSQFTFKYCCDSSQGLVSVKMHNVTICL